MASPANNITPAQFQRIVEDLRLDFQQLQGALQTRSHSSSVWCRRRGESNSDRTPCTEGYLQSINDLHQHLKRTVNRLSSLDEMPITFDDRVIMSRPIQPSFLQVPGKDGSHNTTHSREASIDSMAAQPSSSLTVPLAKGGEVPDVEAPTVGPVPENNTRNSAKPRRFHHSSKGSRAKPYRPLRSPKIRESALNPLYVRQPSQSQSRSTRRLPSTTLSVFDRDELFRSEGSSNSTACDPTGLRGIRSVPLSHQSSAINFNSAPAWGSPATQEAPEPSFLLDLSATRRVSVFLGVKTFRNTLASMLTDHSILSVDTIPETDWFLLPQLNDPQCHLAGVNMAKFEKHHSWKVHSVTGYLVVSLNVLLQYAFFTDSPMPNLPKFLKAVYRSHSTQNPYHNSLKSLDMLLTIHRIMLRKEVNILLEDLDIGAALLASLVRDAGHIGLDNAFLAKTGHRLAHLFGVSNPIERCSGALFTAIVEANSSDWLKEKHTGLELSYRAILLETVTFLVETSAFPFYTQKSANLSKAMASREEWGGSCMLLWRHRRSLLCALMCCAYNSRVFKPLSEYAWWLRLSYQEWKMQHGVETRKKLSIPFVYHDEPDAFRSDLQFLYHHLTPMVDSLTDLLPPEWTITMRQTILRCLSPMVSPEYAALIAGSAKGNGNQSTTKRARWVDDSDALLSPLHKSLADVLR